jgi:hypothetical protein
MGNTNIPDDSGGVHFSEINWKLEPVWPYEDVDLDVFDDAELRTYAGHLQDEATWLRRMVRECLRQLSILTARLAAANRTIKELRRMIRDLQGSRA